VANSEIQFSYDPFILPTPQHRAGLAGLLVHVESLRRRKLKPLPEVSQADDGKIVVRLTRESLQTLWDDLYDAIWEERRSEKKPKVKTIRNFQTIKNDVVDKRTGRTREKTTYIYEVIAPKGGFLDALGLPAPWIKLWREALFLYVRHRDKQRADYKDRLRGQPAGGAKNLWEDLLRLQEFRTRNELLAVSLSSSLLLGAQDVNAERVPFCGSPDENFLLHFWPVVMGVYVPEFIERDGEPRFVGHVLAVPDVSDAEGFAQDFPDTVAQLGSEVVRFGKPREAVIVLPQEGGLEYIHHLATLTRSKVQAGELAYNVAGVEVYHTEKPGNDIRILVADRVEATHALLEQYELIRGHYRDPLFKRQIILNLLRREPWYRGFDRVFTKNDRERFIGSSAGRFPVDVRRCFETGLRERRSA
jgi:CRISPR-associated protein Cmx8